MRGIKKSRVMKTTNDTIDAESIVRYLMIRDGKETFAVPENFMNLRKFRKREERELAINEK